MGVFRFEKLNYIPKLVDEQGALLPWYSNSQYINASTLPQNMALGEMWNTNGPIKDGGGQTFQIVKAAAGLVQGQLVATANNTTGTYTSAGSTVAVINTNVTTTVNEVDNFLVFPTIGVTKRIKYNATGTNTAFTISLVDPTIASKPFDPDALTAAQLAALTNADAIYIFRPYNVIVCTASLSPSGVALGTVTSGNYTIIQKAGLALCLGVGSGTALVANVPAAPSTAGVVIGSAAANQYSGTSIISLGAFAGSSTLLPFNVNFFGQ